MYAATGRGRGLAGVLAGCLSLFSLCAALRELLAELLADCLSLCADLRESLPGIRLLAVGLAPVLGGQPVPCFFPSAVGLQIDTAGFHKREKETLPRELPAA